MKQVARSLGRAARHRSLRITATLHARRQFRALVKKEAGLGASAKIAAGWKRGIDFYTPDDAASAVETAVLNYLVVHGRLPDLVNPRGFNEKVVRSNFFRFMKVPESGNRLLTHRFIPPELSGVIQTPEVVWAGDDLDWETVASRHPGTSCYLKSSHGSGMVRRLSFPLEDAQRDHYAELGKTWLRHPYGLTTGEWWYNAFRPQLLVERDVGGNGFSVNCFCFSGTVGLMVLHCKATGETISLTPDLRLIARRHGMSDPFALFPATQLHTLRAIASTLSADVEFARLDLLVGDTGTYYLGEVTFSPGNGLSRRPRGVDALLGQMWTVNART